MVLGQAVEDDRGHRELLVAEPIDVGVHRQEAVLAVNRPQNPFTLGHFEHADGRHLIGRLELNGSSHEMMTAPGIDGRSRAWRHCS